MRFSRYLELSDFQRELSKLRIQRGSISDSELERLERDRILIPRLRLKYPDTVERRWFEENRYGYRPTGRREKDGPRWDSANDLEKARQYRNFFGWRDEEMKTRSFMSIRSMRQEPSGVRLFKHPKNGDI